MNSPASPAKKQVNKPAKKANRKRVKKTTRSAKPKEKEKQAASQASVMVQLVWKIGVRLFRTPSNEAYAVVPVKRHNEVVKVKSEEFRNYVCRLMYEGTKKAPQNQTVSDVVQLLVGKALYDPDAPTLEVHLRVAGLDDKVYVDLANDSWQVVEIDADGWRIKNKSPVTFVRSKSMLPLPNPKRGGSLSDIRSLVNCGSDDDFLLICGWIVGAFNPNGPFPTLCLHGEMGSGKSTTCEFLRSVIDPSQTPHRALPKDERDLWIAAKRSHVQSFDNVSAIPDWMSDSLCRLSTGGSYASRTLYTDDDEQLFTAIRPILLNGIPDAAVKSDLVDRCIILNLPTIAPSQRITRTEWSERCERSIPKIMGAIFDAVSRALRDRKGLNLTSLSRMADFEQWATAANISPSGSRDAFSIAYQRNREEINETILEASPLANAVITLIHKENSFHGTATVLLKKLKNPKPTSNDDQPLPAWLKTPQTLSGELRRVAPNLGRVGIQVNQDSGRDANRRKLISITTFSGKDRSDR